MQDWEQRAQSPEDVARLVHSGHRVFVHGAAATPSPLVAALRRREGIEGVTLFHLHLEGVEPFGDDAEVGRISSCSLFVGPAARGAIAAGRSDFIPVFLSDIPELFATRRVPLDVAMVQLSPPDRHGMCTLGTSVDCAKAAVAAADVVLAEINRRMPRTHGNGSVPFSAVDAFVLTDRELPQHPPSEEGPVEAAIGEQVARLVPDGACLQAGIGAIPDAALRRLGDKLELGIHTEMFSDGVVDLIETGAVTNRQKPVHPGRTITSFVAGSNRTFEFVDDNMRVQFHTCDRTNDVRILSQIDNLIAINSALQIDLTGQICADSIGHRIYSGIGGQMDFMQAACLSRGGQPIIALPATARGGQVSRITHELTPGSGVVTTRGHVRWVVTEFGAVDLFGKGLKERGEALISIAHPDFRESLRRDLRAIRGL